MPARLEVCHTDIWTTRQQINIASNSGQLEINLLTRAQIIRRTALEYNAKRPSHCYLLSAVISIRKRISYIAQQSSNVSATWPMSRDPYSLTVNRRDAQNWSSHAACPSYDTQVTGSHTCDTQIPGHALKLDHTQVQRAKLRNGPYDHTKQTQRAKKNQVRLVYTMRQD